MTALTDQVADTLDAAADYLTANGWCQQQAFTPNGTGSPSACLVGAIIASKTDPEGGTLAKLAVRLHLNVSGLGNWNDWPSREQWEVVEVLRTTAKRVRSGDLLPADQVVDRAVQDRDRHPEQLGQQRYVAGEERHGRLGPLGGETLEPGATGDPDRGGGFLVGHAPPFLHDPYHGPQVLVPVSDDVTHESSMSDWTPRRKERR